VATLLSLPIERDFRGHDLPLVHRARMTLGMERGALVIEVDAPYFGDPAPDSPVGPTDGLWEYEVSELFIADDAEHYLEIELSPHGHHLALELQGVRNVVRSQLPIDYAATIAGVDDRAGGVRGRYRGLARVPAEYLPERPTRANAYLIHGSGAARAYHAHSPPLGVIPDFHRLSCFVPLVL
jgi:hypothetical protein